MGTGVSSLQGAHGTGRGTGLHLSKGPQGVAVDATRDAGRLRVIADRGYDHDKYRRERWRRGVQPRIARRRTEHGSGLGPVRWVVERTFAWLHNFRRLRFRWERDAALH